MAFTRRGSSGSARDCRPTVDPEFGLIEMAPGGPFFMITSLICALQADGQPPRGRKKCQDNYNNRLFLMT